MTQHSDPEIDPERSHEEKPFDRSGGYSGQDDNVRDEELVRAATPSVTVAARPEDAETGPGAQASFDPETGAVRGSGGPDENYDTDAPNTGEGNKGGAKG